MLIINLRNSIDRNVYFYKFKNKYRRDVWKIFFKINKK